MIVLSIILSVIGGLTVLVGLYFLGVNIAVSLTAHTKMFKSDVDAIIEKRNAKRAEKAKAKELAEEIKQETAAEEIKVEIDKVIDDLKL